MFQFSTFERNLGSERVFFGLGSNVGKREDFLARAIIALEKVGHVVMRSSIYETTAIGPRQRAFLNCVVEVRTNFSPEELLFSIKKIEKKLGRRDRGRWGPREIDIDILLFGTRVVVHPGLQIPHAELTHRRFTLAPLIELVPDFRHPVLGLPLRELLRLCS